MNEKIKKLAEQAGVLLDFGADITVGRWGIGGNYQQMEKFAELIVRECIAAALANDDPYTASDIAGKFGIK
jgi:hypothetical protein